MSLWVFGNRRIGKLSRTQLEVLTYTPGIQLNQPEISDRFTLGDPVELRGVAN